LQFKARNFHENFVPALLILSLLVALGGQLAHWTWVFLAPAPPPTQIGSQTTDLAQASQSIVNAQLFGQSSQQNTVLAAETELNIRLKGVFAAVGRNPSYAIVNIGDKNDVSVSIGTEIQPGVKLHSVHPQYIVVSQEGVLKRVNLDQKQTQNLTSQPGTAKLGISPLGYNAYGISRASLRAAVQSNDPGLKLGRISAAPGGGVLVLDAANGSVAAMLGLQSGDVLRQINGQFIAAPADLSRMIQQFQQVSQIQLELMRGGKVMQLRYSVQQ